MAELELIDRKALIDWLTKATGFKTNCEDCTEIDCLDCIIEEAIKNAPTIEAKPVVHAHWKYEEGTDDSCSNCGASAIEGRYAYQVLSNYCPFCGAQMDEEVSDDEL